MFLEEEIIYRNLRLVTIVLISFGAERGEGEESLLC